MENILNSIILLMCTACLTTVETSELRDCLAELGIDVDSNLIERNLASNSVYAAINFQWQERGAYRHPKAYLLINSATDIQAAIKCGRSLNLEIVARNGGHGYIKSAYGHSNGDNTLILDLKAFKSIVVDQQARTATVDAGALLGHVAYELWENGNFVFPYGICGSVGISGYALGGGHTLLAYKLGLAIDNIIELEMVNANAELLTINNETNTNLFWALRGAGATGSFGIVTKLVLQLHPAPHQIINIDLEYNFEQFHDVYAAYQASVNASFNYRFTLSKGTIKASVSDIQSVTEAETIGAQRIQQAIDLLPAPISPPVQTLLTFTDFLTKLMYVTRSYSYIRPGLNISEPKDLRNIASYGTGSEWFKAKSLFVNKLLSQSEIMEFKELLGTISLPDLYISLETFSGKVNEFHPQMHSSFIHRDAYFDLYAYMVREKADAPVESAKLNEFFEKSKRILNHTTSYQNYADDEMSDALERYYGANLPRLIDIKTEVDPDNFFTSNPQSIPVKNSSGSYTASISKLIFFILLVRVIIANLLYNKV